MYSYKTIEQRTEEFLWRWEFCNAVRAAHKLPELLYREASEQIKRNGSWS